MDAFGGYGLNDVILGQVNPPGLSNITSVKGRGCVTPHKHRHHTSGHGQGDNQSGGLEEVLVHGDVCCEERWTVELYREKVLTSHPRRKVWLEG